MGWGRRRLVSLLFLVPSRDGIVFFVVECQDATARTLHDWINLGGRSGELRLVNPFFLYPPPPLECVSATFRRLSGHNRDTVIAVSFGCPKG